MGQVIYTGGTFDLLHKGHIRFLKSCRKLAGEDGRVVVSLNTDEFIEAYKGKPPVMTFDERQELLLATKYVDFVVTNEFCCVLNLDLKKCDEIFRIFV